MTILNEIAGRARERVEEKKRRIPPAAMRDLAEQKPAVPEFSLETALSAPGISFLCEVKKASPSKGVIAADFPYLSIAKAYEQAGAAALSVLTEPFYFQGHDEYLREIAREVSIPVLRKDFTVDSYQIYEAKALGAAAVLLIAALLDDGALREFLAAAGALGLSALVEAHTEKEVERALRAGARVVGINNRDLHTFTVDITTSLRLRPLVPSSVLFVSESGIRTAADVRMLEERGVDAVLIGETLMRSPDKRAALRALRGGDYL